MHSHPDADRASIMRALGVSARLVARAEARLDDASFARRHRTRKTFAVAAGAFSVLALGLVMWVRRGGDQPGAQVSRDPSSTRTEQSLYAALDARDPAHVAIAAGQLQSEDEAVRLAALRYLMSMGVREPGALRLLNDGSSRVRLAALQYLAAGPPGLPGVSERAVSMALDDQRELAERLLAMDLVEREVNGVDSRDVARRLIPLVSDTRGALRIRGERLLERLLGGRPAELTNPTPDSQQRINAWRRLAQEGA